MRFFRVISRWVDDLFTWGNQCRQNTIAVILTISVLFATVLLLLSFLPPLLLAPIVYAFIPWVVSKRDRPKA